MSYEAKSLNEECGIFGIWGHPDAAQVTYFGLQLAASRPRRRGNCGEQFWEIRWPP